MGHKVARDFVASGGVFAAVLYTLDPIIGSFFCVLVLLRVVPVWTGTGTGIRTAVVIAAVSNVCTRLTDMYRSVKIFFMCAFEENKRVSVLMLPTVQS